MAGIRDCIGKDVKISKNSITIKSENGKTAGVVRNITSLYDLQANKQIYYYQILKKVGAGKISIRECIIKDDVLYVFRNLHSKIFHMKYGYSDEKEKEKEAEMESIYKKLRESGIEVIECLSMK